MSEADLFGPTAAQDDLFADHAPPPRKVMDFQAEARRRLTAALERARTGDRAIWSEREIGKWQILFPQMAGWLPDEDRRHLCFAFAAEVDRLLRAA